MTMNRSETRPLTKAIILSAGQGRRLLPLTEERPKCLLPIAGKTLIEWQIDTLLAAGIEDVMVVTGFGSDRVDALLEQRYGGQRRVETLFNPFYHVSDNLVSCWMARHAMDSDFILLNGDTVFEARLLDQVLASDPSAITLSVDYKNSYDEDDMKVQLDDDEVHVRHVSKTIPADRVHAESIGLTYFRAGGAGLFRQAVEAAIGEPAGMKSWYLSVIDKLAAQQAVRACSIDGCRWAEIDYIEDLTAAEALFTETQSGFDSTDHVELRRSSA